MLFGIATSSIALVIVVVLLLGGGASLWRLPFRLLKRVASSWYEIGIQREHLAQERARTKLLQEQADNEAVRLFLQESRRQKRTDKE